MAKRTYINIRTTPVPASFCHLHEPDTGREYSDDKYKVTLFLDPDSLMAKALAESVAKAAAAEWPDGVPAGAHLPGVIVEPDPEKPDKANIGKAKFVFKSKDAPSLSIPGGQPLPPGTKIMGGDVVRVAGAAAAFKHGATNGVTLYLNGVRLIEKRVRNDFEDDSEDDAGVTADPATDADGNQRDYGF